MHYEIHGERVISRLNDGDSVYVSNFKVYKEGKLVASPNIRKQAITSQGYLRTRILGIDTPELHYPGPPICEKGRRRHGIKIFPQPLGQEAKDFTDKLLPDGQKVILETDQDRGPDTFYDKYIEFWYMSGHQRVVKRTECSI